jgi:hypothetical protein
LPHRSDWSRKLSLETGKIGLSDFVDSDGSQRRRRYSMRELLFRSNDVWVKDRQEPQQLKRLKWPILDLIYEKKKK